jgi:hypothetical protein
MKTPAELITWAAQVRQSSLNDPLPEARLLIELIHRTLDLKPHDALVSSTFVLIDYLQALMEITAYHANMDVDVLRARCDKAVYATAQSDPHDCVLKGYKILRREMP